MESSTLRQRKQRAAIIEPQALFVPYLVATLRRTGADVVRAAPSIPSQQLSRLAPDLLLVAIDECRAPLAVVRRLRRLLPAARIVLYTHVADPVWGAVARGLGADAVVGPADDEPELVSACMATTAISG
ncbi:MAG: hypothetical protein IAI50_00800 [Candidatus Eremiobacteraeota bacterium]|nr:hypothetical protein [Candidatus Eremiobacteraeota bacterium]